MALKDKAKAWLDAGETGDTATFGVAGTVEAIARGVGTIGILLLWEVGALLYGLAFALGDIYPKWLEWVAVAGGLGMVLTELAVAYNGPSQTMLISISRSPSR